MGTISETTPATYPTTVYQIEDGDRADGGPLGPSNQGAIALANRTKWLKEQLAALEGAVANLAADTTPLMNGTASAGDDSTLARGDHCHPTDSSRAPLASPAMTGTPTAPTAPAGTATTQLATTAFVGAAISVAVPPGTVIHSAASAPPAGYFECNGDTKSRAEFAALFAAIGTTFGVGDGATTFHLPDLRGEFIRGWDHGRGVDPARAFGSAQKGTAVCGDFNGDSQVAVFGTATVVGETDQAAIVGVDPLTGADYPNLTATSLPQGTGLYPPDGSNDIWGVARPRNVALMACIKY